MCINTIVVHGILEEGKCKPILYYTTSDDKRACLEVSEGDQLNYFKCWYGEKEPLGEQARMMPQKLQRLSVTSSCMLTWETGVLGFKHQLLQYYPCTDQATLFYSTFIALDII